MSVLVNYFDAGRVNNRLLTASSRRLTAYLRRHNTGTMIIPYLLVWQSPCKLLTEVAAVKLISEIKMKRYINIPSRGVYKCTCCISKMSSTWHDWQLCVIEPRLQYLEVLLNTIADIQNACNSSLKSRKSSNFVKYIGWYCMIV